MRCVIINTVEEQMLESLPGSEIVLPGLADLKEGRKSTDALAVRLAAPRLRALGLDAADVDDGAPAAHQLYQQLDRELGDAAHSRYNAILARVTSFARAAERARDR